MLNDPHNPTGNLYTEKDLGEIAEVCRRNGTLILADEIYAMTTYDFDGFTSLGKIYPEGTFVSNGLSKGWSAGGYRFGYLVLPEGFSKELREAFVKVAGTVYTNVSTPTQYAAVEAFRESDDMEKYFQVTRGIHEMIGTYLSREIGSIKGVRSTEPKGGFYFYLDFNELSNDLKRNRIGDSNSLSGALLAHPYHFAAVTGDACLLDKDDFGARIAFVDYDGKAAFDDCVTNPPKTVAERQDFVIRNAPRMIQGFEALRDFVKNLS